MKKAINGGRRAREKRQTQRHGVCETLEKFQRITRIRGGKSLKLAPKKPEDIL